MNVRFLKANHGDSILISIPENGKIKNILIDGGPGNTYSERNRRTGRDKSGTLKEELDRLFKNEGIIDLLILTHVDDDHIGGLISWFKSSDFKPSYVKEVWFNSGQIIHKHYKNRCFLANNIPFNKKNGNKYTGIDQGDTFEQYLEEHNIWDKKIILSGKTYIRFGAKVSIISPSDKTLKLLLTKWKRESKKPFTGSKKNDYNYTIEQLMAGDKFISDRSKHNGSSIAFILEYNSLNFLFLGDAHVGVVTKELKSLGYHRNNPLQCEFVKISHHGSKANTNKSFLETINTDNYIISTNGKHHNLPNKSCLARIIKNNPKANLLFNYPDLIPKIFTGDELSNFEFKATGVDKLDYN